MPDPIFANYELVNTSRKPAPTRFTPESSAAGRASPAHETSTRSGLRPALYFALLVATILAATGYKLRRDGVFACGASGYAGSRYLAYCQATNYGDYDYGAFWYGLEPATNAAASKADVLFLGDSRLQFGISSSATQHWFDSTSVRYYLLGFAYNGNMGFAGPLLRRLQPHAKMYVINVDRFFRDPPPVPAQTVMRDSSARVKYGEKRFWQLAHRALCTRLASLCGGEAAFFRSRSTGAWVQMGGHWRAKPVAYSDSVDRQRLDGEVAAGREFLSHLPVSRDCILLTLVPRGAGSPGTETGTAKAIASALGVPFVAPEPAGLTTFDGSHLDRQSAERWSAAFVDAAGPVMRKCLNQPPV